MLAAKIQVQQKGVLAFPAAAKLAQARFGGIGEPRGGFVGPLRRLGQLGADRLKAAP